MSSLSWKTRLAIVLSAIWLLIAFSIAVSEKDSLAILGLLGILPLAFLWGIAWIWLGYRKQTVSNESHVEGQAPEMGHKNRFRAIRVLNIVGAVSWSIVGVELLFNKIPEQTPGVLVAIVLMYLLVASSVLAGTAWALSDRGSEKLRVVMRRANWVLIGLWLFGSAGAITLATTQDASQIWSMVGGVFLFALPAWLNIRVLRSSPLDLPPSELNETAGNKWLYAVFLISSVVGLAIYVGLAIRAAVTQGNVAYALGAAIIPSILAYVAMGMRKSPSNNIGLVAGIAVALVISLGGANTWKNIFTAQEIAKVAQKHLDESVWILAQNSNPAPATVSDNTDKSIAQPAASTPARLLSKSEQLEFFSVYIREATERQARLDQAHMKELARINLDAMWEPSNLFSLEGLRQNQQKVAAYMKLVGVMQNDFYRENKWQDDRVLSAAGPTILEYFRRGKAKSNSDTLAMFALDLGNMENVKRLFLFLENQLNQGSAAFRDGQPLFSAQADVETYNALMNQITETQKQFENLQKESIRRRQQGIEKMKTLGDRN